MSRNPGVWVAALSTIAVFTFLYKENPLYRAIEHSFVGLAAGYGLVLGFSNLSIKVFEPAVKGKLLPLLPFCIGMLLFTRYTPKYSYLNRYPIAVMTGVGTGLTVRGAVVSDILRQVQAAIVPVKNWNTLIVIVGTIGVIAYFFFTVSGKPVKLVGSIGEWVMMAAFGASFGNAVAGRISQLIGRLTVVLGDWLGLMPK